MRIHRKAVLVDTHNDVLSSAVLDGIDISNRVTAGQSDLPRWAEGGLDVQFFSIWTGEKSRTGQGFFHDAIAEIDSLDQLVKKNPFKMILAKQYRSVIAGIRNKYLVALVGVEGGHMIEDDLKNIQALYDRGMRYLTLTWNNSTSWASSAMDETLHPDSLKHKGLNDFGKQVVHKLNELGVMVDLSHTGEQTFYDAIAASSKPVLLSHSSVWNLCPVFRNVKDDQIRAVAKNGGVICINFYAGFISRDYDQRSTYLHGAGRTAFYDSFKLHSPDTIGVEKAFNTYYDASMRAVRPTIAQLVDHIDYIVKLVGDDYVGIGSDYDGVSALPVGMDDVTKYPLITKELLRRGYSKKSIRKILGGNALRVMRANMNE